MKHFGNVSHTTLESREKLHNPLCNMAEHKDIAKGAERNQTSLRRDCDPYLATTLKNFEGKKSDLIKKGLRRLQLRLPVLVWKEIRPH